jgi:hypothetical protein
LIDWFVRGLLAGLRLELAEEASTFATTSYQLKGLDQAQCLCLRDVHLDSVDRGQYSAVTAATATTNTLVKSWIKYRVEACAILHSIRTSTTQIKLLVIQLTLRRPFESSS